MNEYKFVFNDGKIALLALLLVALILVYFGVFCIASGVRVVIQPPLKDISVANIAVVGELTEEYLQQLQMVPKPILQSFIANQWRLCIGCGYRSGIIWIEGDGIEDNASPGTIVYHEKTIHLNSSDALLHEFGHYTQYIIRPMEGWNPAYKREAAVAASVLGNYATTNNREYFAECFDYFIRNQNDPTALAALRDIAPATTAIFASLTESSWNLPTTVISIQPSPSLSPIERG